MPLRSVKMNRFIFGFHRRVWCPKWTPASSRLRMVTTAIGARPLVLARWSRAPRLSRHAGWRSPWCPVTNGRRARLPGTEVAIVSPSRDGERAREVDPHSRDARIVYDVGGKHADL